MESKRDRLEQAIGSGTDRKEAIDAVLGAGSRYKHWIDVEVDPDKVDAFYDAARNGGLVRKGDFVQRGGRYNGKERMHILLTCLPEDNVAIAEKRILKQLENLAKDGYQNLN